MKQIDYLRLVATGRASSCYAKPSEQDEALRNLILITGVFAQALTFGIAVLISYLGTSLELDDVSYALLAPFAPFALFLLLSSFLPGARIEMLNLLAGVSILILACLALTLFLLPHGRWPMYLPAIVFVAIVGVVSWRNAQIAEED